VVGRVGGVMVQDPATVYQREGWISFADWLGYSEAAPPPPGEGYYSDEKSCES
jgi:hypothetical protein